MFGKGITDIAEYRVKVTEFWTLGKCYCALTNPPREDTKQT